jgi:hypothetical protein
MRRGLGCHLQGLPMNHQKVRRAVALTWSRSEPYRKADIGRASPSIGQRCLETRQVCAGVGTCSEHGAPSKHNPDVGFTATFARARMNPSTAEFTSAAPAKANKPAMRIAALRMGCPFASRRPSLNRRGERFHRQATANNATSGPPAQYLSNDGKPPQSDAGTIVGQVQKQTQCRPDVARAQTRLTYNIAQRSPPFA